jgi:tetratricopeptide (TPR) repeat protein
MKTKATRSIVLTAIVMLAFSSAISNGASTQPRRIPEGALVPEFSAIDTTGKPFVCSRSGGKALILAFLSSEKKRSREAVEDIFRVLAGIPPERLASLQVAFVLQNVDNRQFIELIQKGAPTTVHILDDDQYDIWGKLGVIATPTVLICDSGGKVLCVKPGHAYDFAPAITSSLSKALGIPYDAGRKDTKAVRTVANSTEAARAKRHLRMAELLSSKNKIGSAIEQAQMAYEIDPNSPKVALELAELLCRTGQAQKAAKLVSAISVENSPDKARVSLVLGWANRQMGKLDKAKEFLQQGIGQDPTLPRLYFELGRIYQQRKDSDKAMQAYFRALQLLYQED